MCGEKRQRETTEAELGGSLVKKWKWGRKCFPWNRCLRGVSHSYHGDPVCRSTLRAITQPPIVLRHTNLHSHTSTRWDFEWQLRCCSRLPGGVITPSICSWSAPWRERQSSYKGLSLEHNKGGKNKEEISVSLLRQFKDLELCVNLKHYNTERLNCGLESNELDSSAGETAEQSSKF